MKKTIMMIFAATTAFGALEATGVPWNFPIGEAVVDAVEYDSWDMIMENLGAIIKNNTLPVMVDSIKARYKTECNPILIDKVIGDFYNAMGMICFENDYPAVAAKYFAAACSLCIKYDYPDGIRANLINQGLTLINLGDTVLATEKFYQAVRSIVDEQRIFENQENLRKHIDVILALDQVSPVMDQAVKFYSEKQNAGLEQLGAVHFLSAVYFSDRESLETAAKEYYLAIDLFRRSGYRVGEMYCCFALAEVYRRMGKPSDSLNDAYGNAVFMAAINDSLEYLRDIMDAWSEAWKENSPGGNFGNIFYATIGALSENEIQEERVLAMSYCLTAVNELFEWDSEKKTEALQYSLDFWTKQKDIGKQVDVLVLLAQHQTSLGEREKTVLNYVQALKLCLADRRWYEAQTLITTITDADLLEPVFSAVNAGLGTAEQAMLYVVTTAPKFRWSESDYEEKILSDSLNWALRIFQKNHDKCGMAITDQLLGEVKDYFNLPVEAEQYHWDAAYHAIELNDSGFVRELLSWAVGCCWTPGVRIDDFDAFLQRQDWDLWMPQLRIIAADEYLKGVNTYYTSAQEIYNACAETLALLDDPRRQQLAYRIAALSLYTDLEAGDFTPDTLRLYQPAVPLEDLKRIMYDDVDSLSTYLDDLSSSCKLRGTDRWCLNYLEMLRGHVYLGWGNVLRIIAEHEYQLASAELKKQWDTLDLVTFRLRALEILLLRTGTYAPRFHGDSILFAYDDFQKRLEGKMYRAFPLELRNQLGEIIAGAMQMEDSGNEKLLKYDLLGFGDRMIELGGSYGSGAGMFEPTEGRSGGGTKEARIEVEEFIMPLRFDYIDVRPVDWDQKRLARIEKAITEWNRNLYWDLAEKNHWDLLDMLLKIELGEYSAADSAFKTSAGISSESKWVKAFYLYLHAELAGVLGRFQEAMDSYGHSTRLVEGLSDNSFMKACVVGNNGNLWLRLGDNEKAQAAFDSVMSLAEENPALKLLTVRAYISRTNLKLIEAIARKDTATINMAINAYGSALSILADVDELNTALAAKINLAVAYLARNDIDAAESTLTEVIQTAEAEDAKTALAGAQALRGYVLCLSGKFTEALECCNQAAALYRQVGDQHSLSNALTTLGSVSRKLGDNENALKYFKESIDIFEAIRAQISSDDISATFTEANTDRYGEIVDLLVATGSTEEAFSYVERSKAKSLKDAIDIAKLETGDAKLRKALEKSSELENVAARYEKELTQEKSRPADLIDSARITELTKTLATTKGEFLKCGNDVKKLNPDYEALVKVTPGQLAKLQPQIAPGTMFLEYYAAPGAVYIFEVGAKIYTVRTVPVKRDSLYAMVRKFRDMIAEAATSIKGGAGIEPISSWNDDASDHYREEIMPLKEVLSALYNTLIAPAAEDLVAVDNIVIIPAGLLTYLPFHALAHDTQEGYKFLVEEKNISYLTASELIDIAKDNIKTTKPVSFLGFADPDGSLPSAIKEVDAIRTVFPKSQVFTLDQATEDNAVNLSADYNILHFATHAMLDDKTPDESYILLAKGSGADGKWFVTEVFDLTWSKMDLVVLSACETALGEKEPGREVATLAYAFSVAGTPSVVASLWPVFDPSTQELMKTFYESFKRDSKTVSLRSAQISLLHNQQYAHPFFWAPFILIGDWR